MKCNLPLLRLSFLILFVALIFTHYLHAQSLDTTFRSPLLKRTSEVYKMIELADKKILIAGDINYFENKNVGRIVRLNPDGSLDKTFRVNLPSDFYPYKMEIMNSGHILVYDFNRLFKLGPNGAVKKSMDLQGLSAVTPLPNDKFMICTWSGGLYRYRSNFTLDPTFPNTDGFANGYITDLEIQGKKYIISGSFSQVNGVNKNDLARLFHNGTVDNTFDTGIGTDDHIGSLTIQPDGRIFPGHTYINSYNGQYGVGGVIRLNKDGSRDSTFTSPQIYGPISTVVLVNDKILIDAYPYGVIKLNSDGSLDNNFISIEDGMGFTPTFTMVADSFLVVGGLKTIGGDYGIAKFNGQGVLQPGFRPALSRVGLITSLTKSNKKLIIGGDFFLANRHHTLNVARLHANGSVDQSFISSENNGDVFMLDVLQNGSILVSAERDFIRLNPNGDKDPAFEFHPFNTLYQVNKFAVQPDGNIVAGGPNGIYRLNGNGGEDTTFNIGTGICCISLTAFDFDFHEAGKIVYGSLFNEFNGVPVNKLTRLNPNASVDTTFDIGSGPNNAVYRIKSLQNKSLIIGGWFSEFNGIATSNGFIRLEPDGTIDTTFKSTLSLPTQEYVVDVEEFANKIIIVTGSLTGYNILALEEDGSRSTDFVLPTELTQLDNISGLYIADDNVMYAYGNISLQNQEKPASIVKIIYDSPEIGPSLREAEALSTETYETPVTFRTYPNPSQNEIKFNTDQDYQIKIIKFSGEIVLESRIGGGVNTLDISSLKPDTYVIQMSSGKGKQTSILIKN